VTADPRLLIRLGSLGDVVLATAAANAAERRWGPGCLDVLVKAEWAAVWDGHPAVRRVWPWEEQDRGPGGVLAMARRLRAQGYRETLDLQASPRTRALALAAGWTAVRRPERHGFRRRLGVWVKRFLPPPDYSVARAFVDTVDPEATDVPTVRPGREARERAARLVPEHGRVGLVPGARHATKRWPLKRFVEVGARLAAEGRGPVPVFFGPDEAPLEAAWRALWPETASWVPIREPLAVAAACLARLGGVVTNDTGLMHLAAAVGVPTVALFGPTVRAFGFFPPLGSARVLQVGGLPCRPCAVHGGPRCPRGHFRCMLEIQPDAVTAALADLAGPVPERMARPPLHSLRSP